MTGMSNAFLRAFREVVGIEGRYSNHPADSGGETLYGITLATARAAGYSGPMKLMPLSEARRIYKREFWDKLNLDAIADTSPEVALEVFEQGVNMGIARAGRNLQSALNVLNRAGIDYPDVSVDGKVGPVTARALFGLSQRRKTDGLKALCRALNVQQGAFYLELAGRREKDESFVLGWLLNRVAL
ncbi:Predicted Peptidoglycan domain-containing protein [Methylomagnum ishizawai]|uniref:Predicted Peptidoglycan domain-containing protein n=2 Tax=Methylomagnum ishizawai TaxID=1760988 RepID=A0A1Y6CWH5_9GAMM|nr:Predicted Peptidoglycan domain-containing protein [Methylomagnum ishizawai]